MIEMPAATVQATKSGVIVLVPEERQREWDELSTWLVLKKVNQLYVKLGKPRKPRTTGWKSQNHHFNGHCQQIANATGDSFDDVKMYIKREAISDGYPTHQTKWGDVVPISEADASTVECAILIETAHRIASFLGVVLKESDDG